MLRTVLPAAVEPVSLVEIKEHLRETQDENDYLIASCVTAAREAIELRTGRALAAATYQWISESEVGCWSRLPLWPVTGITEVVSRDAYGAVTTLVPADYTVDLTRSRLRLSGLGGGYLAVSFTVAPESVPQALLSAVKLLATDLYEQAGGVIVGASVDINPTLAWLVDPHRLDLGV